MALLLPTTHSWMLLQSREIASWGGFVVKAVGAVSVVSVLLLARNVITAVNLTIMLDSVFLGVSPE